MAFAAPAAPLPARACRSHRRSNCALCVCPPPACIPRTSPSCPPVSGGVTCCFPGSPPPSPLVPRGGVFVLLRPELYCGLVAVLGARAPGPISVDAHGLYLHRQHAAGGLWLALDPQRSPLAALATRICFVTYCASVVVWRVCVGFSRPCARCAQLLEGKLVGGVANTFSVGCVDVRDVARAHVAAIEKPEASGRCVTCAPPPTHTHMHAHARTRARTPAAVLAWLRAHRRPLFRQVHVCDVG